MNMIIVNMIIMNMIIMNMIMNMIVMNMIVVKMGIVSPMNIVGCVECQVIIFLRCRNYWHGPETREKLKQLNKCDVC